MTELRVRALVAKVRVRLTRKILISGKRGSVLLCERQDLCQPRRRSRPACLRGKREFRSRRSYGVFTREDEFGRRVSTSVDSRFPFNVEKRPSFGCFLRSTSVTAERAGHARELLLGGRDSDGALPREREAGDAESLLSHVTDPSTGAPTRSYLRVSRRTTGCASCSGRSDSFNSR